MSLRDLRAEQNYELALLWERARAIADATGEPIQTPALARARAKTRQAKRDVAIGQQPPPPVPVACSFPPEPPHALSIPLPSLPLPTFVPRPATELPQPLPKSQSAPAIKPAPPLQKKWPSPTMELARLVLPPLWKGGGKGVSPKQNWMWLHPVQRRILLGGI